MLPSHPWDILENVPGLLTAGAVPASAVVGSPAIRHGGGIAGDSRRVSLLRLFEGLLFGLDQRAETLV